MQILFYLSHRYCCCIVSGVVFVRIKIYAATEAEQHIKNNNRHKYNNKTNTNDSQSRQENMSQIYNYSCTLHSTVANDALPDYII